MRWALVLLLVPLSGCFDPAVPDHATETQSPDLPGVVLTTWAQDERGRLRMHALVENTGDESFDIRIGCGHPWDSRVVGASGEVHYREVVEEVGCAAFWDVLRPQATMDTLYSWDYQDHDVENDTATPVPAGEYTWVLRFETRDGRSLESRISIHVGDLQGFRLALDTNGTAITATVTNEGDREPEFWTGCGMEWDAVVLHDGEEVPREPMATCQGFTETTFPPGHSVNATFTWDGMAWDPDDETSYPAEPGTYEWRITFGLQGARETITATASFQLD